MFNKSYKTKTIYIFYNISIQKKYYNNIKYFSVSYISKKTTKKVRIYNVTTFIKLCVKLLIQPKLNKKNYNQKSA